MLEVMWKLISVYNSNVFCSLLNHKNILYPTPVPTFLLFNFELVGNMFKVSSVIFKTILITNYQNVCDILEVKYFAYKYHYGEK